PLALLEFPARAARAWIVAADLLRRARERLLRLRGWRRSRHRRRWRARRLGFGAFGACGRPVVGMLVLHVLQRAHRFLGLALGFLDLLARAHLHRHQVPRHLALDGIEHRREELEGLALVLLLRLLLRIAAQ